MGAELEAVFKAGELLGRGGCGCGWLCLVVSLSG